MNLIAQSPAISGCKIELVNNVIKKSCNPDYSLRLNEQAYKQQEYKKILEECGIYVPIVHRMLDSHFYMEYLPYKGYINFVSENSILEVKKSLLKIIDWIAYSVHSVEMDYEVKEDYLTKEISRKEFPSDYKKLADDIFMKTKSY